MEGKDKFSKLEWEYIEMNMLAQSREAYDFIRRAKVPGGWLVESVKKHSRQDGLGFGVGLTYIPDPRYEWKIE
ncbi:MAG: hypothetical protein GPJ52_02595 [Candidatus Heimdallarchaeota archaeon]|nr:hypothetical protein [Candidatus Heimdallarchaeota archaeon]